MSIQIDANNQSLGRLASKVAVSLRGKDKPAYKPNVLADIKVTIKNIEQAKFTGKKLTKKIYYRYSGYHGGIKEKKLSDLWATRPKYVFREMVYRMLPKNKSRDKIIKNLKFDN
ncbi:MAG: 50S ribosomal protein L13 [Candidatus Yanofskybacteria bacterium CG10_big_fil_rev_8_21_14_0_10_37_15]|uniref:Large ribosomal subunit protein uL13 n=1 Tax=Candidatus Yanofskybacteria bacterium CG10_big_fil_rev_8_21_14_0_10_37_15 TaxID=1975097 RepID=A0A2H0R5E8_9BACT|nr:MAG: 50S ribosomal protein L13 [Candidatus Yanofskybacteria bacterium CG10_big_fil_rev_8_21_14_0_10_37_15]